jgi:hypothetical protein
VTDDQWDYSFVTFLPGDIQPEKLVNAIHPVTGIPIVVAWVGKTHADGDPAATIAFEFPFQTHHPVDKPGQELNDVNIFLRDSLPTERITLPAKVNPTDPPDVIAYVDGQELGIEATQLLLPEELGSANSAIARWNTFDKLRQKILHESNRQDFAQHEGLLAVAYFGGYVGSPMERLPPRRPIDVESAIAELKQMNPVVRPLAIGGRQDATESDFIRYSADKSVGFTWSKLPPGYGSGHQGPFHDEMKFELAMGYNLTVTLNDLRSELRRLITEHDNPQTDILLITVNASMKSGLWFPAGQIVADLLFEDEQPLSDWEPSHVKRIALHDQQTFTRRGPDDKGRVRWIHGRNPWTWT